MQGRVVHLLYLDFIKAFVRACVTGSFKRKKTEKDTLATAQENP